MSAGALVRLFNVIIVIGSLTALVGCGAVPSRQSLDLDSDGIADGIDGCPGTPLGTPVNDDGCSVFNGILDDVVFEPGEHRLNLESREALKPLVTILNNNPQVVIRLGGHTDNRGSASDNLALSKSRVMSVVKFLVANGVAGERLQPFGFGESRPVMSNSTPDGRAKNRRIEVSVVSP